MYFQLDETSFTDNSFSSTIYENPSEASIFVYESVELELSLATSRVDPYEPVEEDFTCPIKIVKGKIKFEINIALSQYFTILREAVFANLFY